MNYNIYEKSQTAEIVQLFTDTFTDSEGAEEGKLIGNLTNELLSSTSSDDLYVFVATEGTEISACMLFSRLTFNSPKTAFLLAPVAVGTSYQGKGTGKALIRFGIQAMKEQGTDLIFTYGDPAFYTKSGFERITEKEFKAPLKLTYPHGWMAQSLTEDKLEAIAGASQCVSAFNDQALW